MKHFSARDFEKSVNRGDFKSLRLIVDEYQNKHKTHIPQHVLATCTRNCYQFSTLSFLHSLCPLPDEIWISKLVWGVQRIQTVEGLNLYTSVLSEHADIIKNDRFTHYMQQALTKISQTETAKGAAIIEKIKELVPFMSQVAKNELYAICAMSVNDYLYSLKDDIGFVRYDDIVSIWDETIPGLRLNPESVQNERLKESLSELSKKGILNTLTEPNKKQASKRKI